MRYEIFVGLRYLRSRRKRFFVSFITLICVGGVAIGVATVVVALSVMNGWESIIRDKMLRSEGHIAVSEKSIAGDDLRIADYLTVVQKIREIDGVVAAAPVIFRQAYLQTEENRSMGVMVRAIDPELQNEVTNIGDFVSGDLSFESPLIQEAESRLVQKAKEQGFEQADTILGGIILGKGVADRLKEPRDMRAPPDVIEGKLVHLTSKLEQIEGKLQPLTRRFVVVGVYESGMYTYDSAFAFVSLKAGQELYNIGSQVNPNLGIDTVDMIEVRVKDIYKAEEIGQRIRLELRGLNRRFGTRTWMEAHKNLFDAIRTEKIVTFVIEALIVFVAAFNIASTLVMMVMKKTKEIGILKSMGATKRSVWFIFTFEGILIGLVGAVLGTLLGLFICWSLNSWLSINIPNTIYQIDRLPAEINWPFLAFVNLASLAICWFATIYPAWRASTLKPVEALRYE